MVTVDFDYKKASTVEEALEALASREGKLLAGGYSLIPSMKLRLSQPEFLIDISSISSLKGIQEENGYIVIRAGTTHAEIHDNALIQENLSFFHKAASVIGDVQVRNRGTIGGSLAHADPAADWPALVLAADAVIDVVSRNGSRSINATDFFTGLFSTALEENELITAIRIPVPAEGTRTVYMKYEHPASRFAIVGCAIMRFPDGKTNIAFTGAAEYAFRDTAAEQALAGKALDGAAIEAAVNAALQGQDVSFMGDYYASAEYRQHLAKVYLKRALEAVV
ncbi:xanthine dehydrogenase family protein subunit M [Nibrella saemangeumensis]|uniref:Xanthine dehydrogenase family protein subunit M n=1 Tax=Nibrella saemangeumensis TaxID=1084526 RepID=A0ABP8MTP3_9BACT